MYTKNKKMIFSKLIFSKHLEKGEEIQYVIHKHWSEMTKPILEVLFFGFLTPWALYFIGFSTPTFFWVAVIWSAIAVARFIYVLVDWISDAWLITNMNIIVVEWSGIFSNLSARVGYTDIEGASYEIKGFWGTIFRYGDMTLRVISGSHFDLKKVSNPKKAELALSRFQDKYLSDRNIQDATSLKSLLSDMVSHHIGRVK